MILETNILHQYRQSFPHEHHTISACEKYLQLCQKHAETPPRFATGSAWLINPNNGKILLTHHKNLDRWLQPGGKINKEDNLSILQTALREAQEESGIKHIALSSPELFHLDIHYIPAQKNQEARYYYDFCFLHHITQDQPLSKSAESLDLKWFSMAELMQMDLENSIEKMVKKWQHKLFSHDLALDTISAF
jgi:8-oxo-dGTP pyrophosphatase MutT (NUDIX family)